MVLRDATEGPRLPQPLPHRGSGCAPARRATWARPSSVRTTLDLRTGRSAARRAEHGRRRGLRPAGLPAQAGRARRVAGVPVPEPRGGPEPFAEALPGLAGRFGPGGSRSSSSVHQTVYEVDSNWKLFFHNYSECYHCPNVHPHLNKLTPYRQTENDLAEGPVLGGPMWMCNPEGSMTMPRRALRAALPGLSPEERGRVYYYMVFPTAFLSFIPTT